MKHFFDVEIANEYGVHAANMLEHFAFWIKHNEANEDNFYDGKYWTYNSRKAFKELFPYMSKRQIETALEKLIQGGLIVTGNYNKVAYDRTLWYALTEKGKSILHYEEMQGCKNVKSISQNGEMEITKWGNGISQNVPPIPDINTDKNSDINTGIDKRFKKPTAEEVRAYCRERGNKIDAEYFIDYYESRGWLIGKSRMKDWKAAVRTWERYDKKDKKDKPKEERLDDLDDVLL